MLERITVGVTSFLRAGFLEESLRTIQEFLPECRVIVADDSDSDLCAEIAGDGCLRLQFDEGLSRKRNELVKVCKTPLFLLWTDDFKADEQCRTGVLKMLEVLDGDSAIDVAAGRVNHVPYECWLEYKHGSHVREHRIVGTPPYWRVDLAANYFLARTASIVPWEDRCLIGGEHCLWWLAMKQAGRVCVILPQSNVNTLDLPPSAQDDRYPAFRGRCYEQGHAVMKEILCIQKYYGMAGDVS